MAIKYLSSQKNVFSFVQEGLLGMIPSSKTFSLRSTFCHKEKKIKFKFFFLSVAVDNLTFRQVKPFILWKTVKSCQESLSVIYIYIISNIIIGLEKRACKLKSYREESPWKIGKLSFFFPPHLFSHCFSLVDAILSSLT